jgi:hypothetical protein
MNGCIPVTGSLYFEYFSIYGGIEGVDKTIKWDYLEEPLIGYMCEWIRVLRPATIKRRIPDGPLLKKNNNVKIISKAKHQKIMMSEEPTNYDLSQTNITTLRGHNYYVLNKIRHFRQPNYIRSNNR